MSDEKWSIDPTWEGNRSRIQNQDGRTVAIIFWGSVDPTVVSEDVGKLFAASLSMYRVCEKLVNAWKHRGNQAHVIQAAVSMAKEIVEEVENNDQEELE